MTNIKRQSDTKPEYGWTLPGRNDKVNTREANISKSPRKSWLYEANFPVNVKLESCTYNSVDCDFNQNNNYMCTTDVSHFLGDFFSKKAHGNMLYVGLWRVSYDDTCSI